MRISDWSSDVCSSDLSADASQQRADSLEVDLADLRAKRTERGLVLTLGDVLFDTGQAVIRSGAYGTLDRLATALKDRPERSRSEERRVGKECVSKSRYRVVPAN